MASPSTSPIYLDDHLPDGYVFVCSHTGSEYSFILRRLGPSIECPRCDHTALSAELLDAYYKRTVQVVETYVETYLSGLSGTSPSRLSRSGSLASGHATADDEAGGRRCPF